MNPIPHSKTWITEQDVEAVSDQLINGFTTSGVIAKEFETQFLDHVGGKYGALYSSGTSALAHIIRSLRIPDDKHVLIPNYICIDVYQAIASNGIEVVVYDNSENSWLSNNDEVFELINPNTAAVIINHIFGIACDKVQEIKSRYPNVGVIEDCCHTIPKQRQIDGTPVLQSDFCFFSFNSTKMLAGGEGGMVVSKTKELHDALLYSKSDKGMTDLSARLALSQLERVGRMISRRKEIAEFYTSELSELDVTIPPTYGNQFFRYTILVEPRLAASILTNQNVSFRKGVDNLIHLQRQVTGKVDNSIIILQRTVSLPIYPALTFDEAASVIKEIKYELHK